MIIINVILLKTIIIAGTIIFWSVIVFIGAFIGILLSFLFTGGSITLNDTVINFKGLIDILIEKINR